MEKQKEIIFLHQIHNFETLCKIKHNLKQNSSIKMISTSLELDFYLDNQGIKYYTFENYYSNDLGKAMDEFAFEIVKKWHKNLFLFQKISLGQLFQWKLNYFFSRIIKNVQVLLNVIETEKPTKIISFEESDTLVKEFNKSVKYVCRTKQVAFEIVSNGERPIVSKRTAIYIHKNKHRLMIQLISLKKFILRNVSKILLVLLKIVKRRKKNILIYHSHYYPSLIKRILENYNLFIIYYNVNLSKLIENIKSVFSRKGKIHNLFFSSYPSIKIKKKANLYYNSNYIKWKEIFNDFTFRKSFNYNEISLWPLVSKKIFSIIFHEFKIFIRRILVIKKILKKSKIDGVILGNDVVEDSMIVSIVCLKSNIPTFVIQHGITGHKNGFLPSFSKYFASWGKISREFLIRNGMDITKIILTGCPRFDNYFYINKNPNLKREIKEKIYKEYGIKKDTKLIVLTTFHGSLTYRFNTSVLNSEIINFFDVSLNTFKNVSDIHIIIKLHYNDKNIQMTKDLIKLYGLENTTVVRDTDIVDLIVACDCFISGESTTVIEAMLVEKPVICISFNEREYITPFFEYNSVYKATNSNELIKQINRAFRDPLPLKNREQFLKDYLYRLDGLSTRRVMNLINNTISKKSN